MENSTTIVCLGDSITAGVLQDIPAVPEAQDNSWPSVVRSVLGVRVINKGWGGQTTTEILSRFDADVLPYNPTHCIIMAGINDAYHSEKGVTLAQSKSNFVQLIQKCYDNGIVPIVGRITPTDASTYSVASTANPMVAQIRDYQTNYCNTNGITMIDFYVQFKENISSNVITSLLESDGLHPNVDGYRRMGYEATRVLRLVLPDRLGTTCLLEEKISFYKAGEAPHISWDRGDVVINNNPSSGDVFGWQCVEAGSPGKWVNMGRNRSMDAGYPSKITALETNDTSIEYFEVGDIVFWKATSSVLVMYKVTKAGYSNAHSDPTKRATFVTFWSFPIA